MRIFIYCEYAEFFWTNQLTSVETIFPEQRSGKTVKRVNKLGNLF